MSAMLWFQNVPFGCRFFKRFSLVDKQSYDVKQSCKPSDYKNDMKRFDVLETHCQNFGLN